METLYSLFLVFIFLCFVGSALFFLWSEYSEKGIVGATIGRKTITKKEATQLTCKNCGMEWTL